MNEIQVNFEVFQFTERQYLINGKYIHSYFRIQYGRFNHVVVEMLVFVLTMVRHYAYRTLCDQGNMFCKKER